MNLGPCGFAGEVDYKEIGDCVHASGYSSTDLCLPALDYLRRCSQVGQKAGIKVNVMNKSNSYVSDVNINIISSKNGFRSSNSSKIPSIKNLCSNKAASEPQLLAKIYKMPSKPVFLVARLASLPVGTQERSMSTEDGMDCVLQEFDDGTGESSSGVFTSVLACLTVFSILQV